MAAPTLGDTLNPPPRRHRKRAVVPWWHRKRAHAAGVVVGAMLLRALCTTYGQCPPPEPPGLACALCDEVGAVTRPLSRAAIETLEVWLQPGR